MSTSPSPEAVAALVNETGMGKLQAIRHLQQRAELQRRAVRTHRFLRRLEEGE